MLSESNRHFSCFPPPYISVITVFVPSGADQAAGSHSNSSLWFPAWNVGLDPRERRGGGSPSSCSPCQTRKGKCIISQARDQVIEWVKQKQQKQRWKSWVIFPLNFPQELCAFSRNVEFTFNIRPKSQIDYIALHAILSVILLLVSPGRHSACVHCHVTPNQGHSSDWRWKNIPKKTTQSKKATTTSGCSANLLWFPSGFPLSRM